MIRVFPEQLLAHLKKKLYSCYILAGNEMFFIQESFYAIRNASIMHDFKEHLNVVVDTKTDWDSLFSICQLQNLFTKRQIISLQLPKSGINTLISKKLMNLFILLHRDILLVIQMNNFTKAQENTPWFKKISTNSIFVPCQKLEKQRFMNWIINRIKEMNINLDNIDVLQFLCYYFEGNLLELVFLLNRFLMVWPDRKLTLLRIKQLTLNHTTHFTSFDWIDALLDGKVNKALHILYNLEKNNVEIIIILRFLQKFLLKLLYLQRNQNKQSLPILMNEQGIWPNKRSLFIKALKRIDKRSLELTIHLLAQIDLSIKKDYNQKLWPQLQTISLLLCYKN